MIKPGPLVIFCLSLLPNLLVGQKACVKERRFVSNPAKGFYYSKVDLYPTQDDNTFHPIVYVIQHVGAPNITSNLQRLTFHTVRRIAFYLLPVGLSQQIFLTLNCIVTIANVNLGLTYHFFLNFLLHGRTHRLPSNWSPSRFLKLSDYDVY
jgi:hypothetical protein